MFATANAGALESCESTCRSILVPLDGSQLSERALPFAVALARQHDCSLLLMEASDEQHPNVAAEAYLQRWADRLAAGCGIAVVPDVAVGDAGRAIVEEAARRGVELIVMATHARTGVERMLKGSVADYVLHNAAAPVLLVPEACDRAWGG